MKARTTLLGAALIVALITSLSAGIARADRPKVEEEKGAPGSGIKKIVHVYRETGVLPPNGPAWLETNREIVFDNGTTESQAFHDDGRTICYSRLADATGLTTRYTEYDKSGVLMEDIVHEKN